VPSSLHSLSAGEQVVGATARQASFRMDCLHVWHCRSLHTRARHSSRRYSTNMSTQRPNRALQRTRHERPAMNPTGWILILFAACVAWIPAAVYLGKLAAQHQDAAGRGIYSLLTTMFLLVVGGLSFGIPALFQARRHRQQVHVCMRVAAWLILLSPVLVAGSVILSELIGDMFR
jgi:cation transport ATPase